MEDNDRAMCEWYVTSAHCRWGEVGGRGWLSRVYYMDRLPTEKGMLICMTIQIRSGSMSVFLDTNLVIIQNRCTG